jgi:hypothetical protein
MERDGSNARKGKRRRWKREEKEEARLRAIGESYFRGGAGFIRVQIHPEWLPSRHNRVNDETGSPTNAAAANFYMLKSCWR